MGDKNVILIVADALRADRPSYTGYRRDGKKLTPNIDSIAEDGRIYERAYSPGPWTPVAQPALLTGNYSSKMGYPNIKTGIRLDEGYDTIASKFNQEGYETRGYNHANMIDKKMGFGRGFDYYEDLSRKGHIEKDFWHMEGMLWNAIFGRDNRTRYALKSIKRWLGNRRSDRPFFLFWNPTNPHNKYRAPQGFRNLERDIEAGMDMEAIEDVAGWGHCLDYVAGNRDLDDEEMEVVQSRYDAEIKYLDHRIGQLVDYLKRKNMYEDTTIVITADHGENFGDFKRLLHHDFSVNEALIRVPLVIKGESFERGREEAPASTLDIFNSLYKGVLGKEDTYVDSMPALIPDEKDREIIISERDTTRGKSLEEKLEDKKPLLESIEWYTSGLKAAIKDDSKLVLDEDENIREYDVSDVSEKESNISSKMRQEIVEKLERLGGFKSKDGYEEEVKSELEKLGYV